MQRLAVIAFAVALGGAFALPLEGCRHPYSGKAERIKKPRKKKRKDKPEGEQQPQVVEAPAATPCRTNFFTQPARKPKRSAKEARELAVQADSMLLDAERTTGETRVSSVLQAMNKLTNALKKDPYGPEPTFKFAVAYALIGKKSCALAFLERLNLLQQFPDTEREAARVIQRALREPAFDPFRKDANTAMGQ
jgi:hypothetical protein